MQQIIVYRNPLEAAFWNATASAEVFVVGVGVVCFFVVFLLFKYFGKRKVKYWYRYVYPYPVIAVSALISYFVMYKIWV